MSSLEGQRIRERLQADLVTGGGSSLPKEAFTRFMKDPKFMKELASQGVVNPKGVLRSIVRGVGELTTERARHLFGAVRNVLRSGVEFGGYGAIRLRSSAARVSPKTYVSKIVNAAAAEGKEQAGAANARRARFKFRRTVLQNVRKNAPITQRLSEEASLRKGQLIAEAQAERDESRNAPAEGGGEAAASRPPGKGSVSSGARPASEAPPIGGATASYLTGAGAEAPLQTTEGQNAAEPTVKPDAPTPMAPDESGSEPEDLEIG